MVTNATVATIRTMMTAATTILVLPIPLRRYNVKFAHIKAILDKYFLPTDSERSGGMAPSGWIWSQTVLLDHRPECTCFFQDGLVDPLVVIMLPERLYRRVSSEDFRHRCQLQITDDQMDVGRVFVAGSS